MNKDFFSALDGKVAAATSLAAGLILLAGCGEKAKEAARSGDEPVVVGPQYSAKKGLLVPKDTSESLGLKVVEVSERPVVASIDLQLRVFRNNKTSSMATAAVPPDTAKLLKPGQTVSVRDGDNEVAQGRISELNAALEKTTGASELLVEIPNDKTKFDDGSFLRGRATLDKTNTVVAIPREALLECSDGYSVYTVSGEHFVRAPIKIGASSGDYIEVTDGLYAGDKVVSQPVMPLWLTELAAVKGGHACCVEPSKKSK